MTDDAALPPAQTDAGGSPWFAVGLIAAPAITIAGLVVAPHLAIGEGAAALVTFVGGASTGLAALAIAAPGKLSPRTTLTLAVGSAGALGAAAAMGVGSRWALVLVNAAIVTFAHAVGGAVGRRVAHPGHLLPACVVAAAADLASVLHPAGPSHAIASSDRALAVLTLGAAVPGTPHVAPALGAGDLLFLALVLGAAATHRMSIARTAALGAAGVIAAGILSAIVGAPVPALVTIGVAIVAGLPAARRLRAEDRRTAGLSVAIAAAVLAALGMQRLTAREPAAEAPADAGADDGSTPR